MVLGYIDVATMGPMGATAPPLLSDMSILSMLRLTPTIYIARSYLCPPHLYVASDAPTWISIAKTGDKR